MFTQIKKQLKIDWHSMIVVYIAMVVFALAGFGIGLLIHYTEPGEKYVPVGLFMAAVLGVMVILILTFIQFITDFNLLVSMGVPRKHFICAYLASGMILNLGALLLWGLLGFAEINIWRIFFPKAVLSENFFAMIPVMWKYGLLAILGVLFLGTLAGAILLRFGKIGGVILWFIWMAGCLLPMRMFGVNPDKADTFLARIGTSITRTFTAIPGAGRIILIAALLAVCFGATYALLRRQEVRG